MQLAIFKQRYRLIHFALPQQVASVSQSVERTTHLLQIFHQMKPIENFLSFNRWNDLADEMPNSIMSITQAC
jgi:hypothetical protein